MTFANSGAEAVEAAIKLCRAATGRLGILSTHGSFHGKTLGALSATGNPDYQRGFGAPAADFDQVPYGDAEALRRALADRPGHYAAFLVEPIQGEGGIVEPPPGYLAEVRAICHEAGVLLALDEIQTGLGRTGDLFACEAEGVVPDVMMLAKALGGGLIPIGAVLCTEEAYSSAFAMKHSSTFAGNALACRAGLATLETAHARRRPAAEAGRPQRASASGAGSKELAARYPHLIAEIRGRGYMLGIRFERRPRPLAGQPPRRGRRAGLLHPDLLQLPAQRRRGAGRPDAQRQLRDPHRAAADLPLEGLREAARGARPGARGLLPRIEIGRVLKSILEGSPQPRSASDGRPEAAAPGRAGGGRDAASPSCSTR